MQYIIFRQIPSEPPDLLVLELWEHGTTGIVEDPAGLRAYFEDGRDLSALLAAHSALIFEIGTEQAPAPVNTCDGWEPVFAGNRFFIVTPPSTDPVPPGRMRLAIEAAGAFGSGRHESTQLVIEALEMLLKSGDVVIDVGCGSGILLSVASMLGARHFFGCDIQAEAIQAAHTQTSAPLFLGAADAVCDGVADLTLANISASVVDTLAFDLNRVTKRTGAIVLAGFIEQKVPQRFTPEQVLQKGEWLCWICRPAEPAYSGPIQPFQQQWW